MIDKYEMHDELVLSIKNNEITDNLCSMFVELANGVAHHRLFKNYSNKEDLAADGVLHLLEVWKKFDITNIAINPFGYFTKCLFRYYMKLLTKEIKYNQLIVSNSDIEDFINEYY